MTLRYLSRQLAVVFITFSGASAADPFADFVRTSPKLSPGDEQKTFKLPPGFEIQLVASEPEIAKPISMAFDAAGRLWVAETRFYPVESAADKTPRDTIRILSDFGDDGRAQKIETFADGLNTPDAIAPYRDGAITFSIPNILLLRDEDPDGRAERRDVLYGPFATRDTHNMANNFRRGFDGWFYAGHGVANDTRVKGSDGHEIAMKGSTFRFRGDGSRIELVGRGQVNPFGVCFDPLGNVYASDCHSAPIYQLLYGAFYPSFGQPDDGLGFGPVMMRHSHDSTAIAGLCYYDDDLWPKEFRGNMFLGNVMTSRVNRDRLIEKGSTRIAEEMPDLLASSDPWFRPVDVQLGPDGALYIADFYNRIIAHVEVPLNHPGRDRESGRIWRMVYRGADGKHALRTRRDLTKAGVVEVAGALGDPNFTLRLTALNLLADTGGPEVIAESRKALLRADANPHLKAGALWVLERAGSLRDTELAAAAARDQDRLVRTHALRVLVERKELSPAERHLTVSALQDSDPLVQRTAADALARHPAFENIAPLLALRRRATEEDTHLVFMTRKALRDQLLSPDNFARLAKAEPSEADARAIADVALAVPSGEAAAFLLGLVRKYSIDQAALAGHLRHITRHASESGLEPLARFVLEKFGGDLDFQVELFRSVEQGIEQRGIAMPASLRNWGSELAVKLLDPSTAQKLAWTNTPLAHVANATNPWFVQMRASADGTAPAPFLCSLPSGGESLTGTLCSPQFAIPGRLSFWLAGHDGRPETPLGGKNLIRLRDAATGKVLAEAPAPRNDLAQRVVWNLAAHEGRTGVIEIVDADTGNAFAWIAAGRFSPAVAVVPEVTPSSIPERQRTAAELALKLRLADLREPLTGIAADASGHSETRGAAVKALLVIDPSSSLPLATALLNDGRFPLKLREEIGGAMAQQNSPEARHALRDALRLAPQRLQIKHAQALAGTAEGAEALLTAIAAGNVPGQLLLDRVVKDKMSAARPIDAAARVAQLSAGLKPASERLRKLTDERRDGFFQVKADTGKGAQIFAQACAICHSLGGKGGNLGPQLDGVGHRGLDRLCEDILDPNRNVDRVFRYSIVTQTNGEVISGLFRREEGDLLIFADPTGKEITIPKKSVRERTESETSLMPEIFADTLTASDLYDLLAFLLANSTPVSKQ